MSVCRGGSGGIEGREGDRKAYQLYWAIVAAGLVFVPQNFSHGLQLLFVWVYHYFHLRYKVHKAYTTLQSTRSLKLFETEVAFSLDFSVDGAPVKEFYCIHKQALNNSTKGSHYNNKLQITSKPMQCITRYLATTVAFIGKRIL